MSHLIETMAYTGQTPWHQLGHALPKKQSIDVWAQAAGMQWKIQETPVRYLATGDADAVYGEALEFPEQKVLYRSDTNAALSVVSQRYKVVQPQEVLEFYRDLSEVAGFELETAGVLKAGRRFWALARTGKSACLKGNDVVHSYLLLATSCDGTLATMAIPTSVRVVCNNTLAIALQGANAGIPDTRNPADFVLWLLPRQMGAGFQGWQSHLISPTSEGSRWGEA